MSGNGADEQGVVSRQAVLDLSRLTSPEQLAAISRIERVGAVVVPESLAGAYAKIPSSRVGATIYVPDGSDLTVRGHTGLLVLGGDGLGGPGDVLAVVGLLIITSPVAGPVPTRISVVGSVLAPRGSESALGPALAGGTGAVTFYPYREGQDIKVLTGQVRLSAAALANAAGEPDDILIVAGQAVVTGPISTLGYRLVVVAGQLAAPEDAREVLEPRLLVQGQAGWYGAGQPRAFFDDTELGPDFFRVLDRPVSLVLFGDLTLAAGVTEAMLRERVADVIGFGDMTAPAGLVGVVQALVTDAFGAIRAGDGPAS